MSEGTNNLCIITVDSGIETISPQISRFTDSFDCIKFVLDQDFTDYTLCLITDADGKIHLIPTGTEALTLSADAETENTYLLWYPQNEITCQSGIVTYQIAAYKTENSLITSVWYSKEGRIIVNESIDTTSYSTALIGSNPNLITQLITSLSAVSAEVTTLSGDVTELSDDMDEAQTNIATLDSNKVDKIESKGLSENDYTTVEKTKLAGIAESADVNVLESVKVDGTALSVTDKSVNIDLSGKVDKVSGKGLSENEYTTAEKTKLSGIAESADVNVLESVKVDGTALSVTDKAVNIDLSGKVDKVTGKGLSENDYTTAEKTKLAGLSVVATSGDYDDLENKPSTLGSGTGMNRIIIHCEDTTSLTTPKSVYVYGETKVDKINGKGLSENDYTTAEKTKLSGIAENADVNVLESVKVDGTALSVSGKAVNIDLSGKVNITQAQTAPNSFTSGSVGDLVYNSTTKKLYTLLLIDTMNDIIHGTTTPYYVWKCMNDFAFIPEIKTEINNNSLFLFDNQEARLGELTALTLTMPEIVVDLYESYFVFKSGATATNLVYSATPIIWVGDDVDSDGVFIPEANTTYEVCVKNLGTAGVVARVGAIYA